MSAASPPLHTWLAQTHIATLSTLLDGAPFGSLVTYALTDAFEPLLWLSDLAVHTQCLLQNPACSLLVVDPAATAPLASWRVTLLGQAQRDDTQTERYFARHPHTPRLGGFHTYRLSVARVRYIEGFGAMGWTTLSAST